MVKSCKEMDLFEVVGIERKMSQFNSNLIYQSRGIDVFLIFGDYRASQIAKWSAKRRTTRLVSLSQDLDLEQEFENCEIFALPSPMVSQCRCFHSTRTNPSSSN